MEALKRPVMVKEYIAAAMRKARLVVRCVALISDASSGE